MDKSTRRPGRPKGSLNKSTLEKIANGEIEDPRYVIKKHYKHPGRPKKQVEKKRHTIHLSYGQKMEKCYQYAVDWCYKHNAALYKYNVDFFVFRYKQDETQRRYKRGYGESDYPDIWIPFTARDHSIEM